jgi:hypothetical protein
MSTHDPLRRLASDAGFDIKAATREQLVAHVQALEELYRAHPAQRALEGLHRYLFPERYAAVAMYEWHAGTLEDVAARLELALPHAPGAQAHATSPRSER